MQRILGVLLSLPLNPTDSVISEVINQVPRRRRASKGFTRSAPLSSSRTHTTHQVDREMAYRSSISTIRSNLRKQRFQPFFTDILHEDDNNNNKPKHPSHPTPTPSPPNNSFIQNSSPHAPFRRKDHPLFPFGHGGLGLGSSFCNYSSSSAINEGSEKIGFVDDVAEVLTEKGAELADLASQAPAVSEVAIAAADSYFPVAALQYLIDGVHSFTGLNWWASIAVTTMLIRGATVPLLINQLKASTKLAMMRSKLEEIKQEMEDKAMDPNAVSEGQKRMQALFMKHGVTPFTPLKGILISGPVFVSFFLAINNMVEKVPSFKEGGVLWFTDLTTPDSLYIFPVLTSLTFLITVEFNMQEGMEGNPAAGTMKSFSRVLALLTIPFTMSFPKAIFCYWVTSNFFSLTYGLVMKRPQVKKYLGIPELAKAPTTQEQRAFSLLSAFKGRLPTTPKESSTPNTSEPPKTSERRISSSSVISQRIRNLEKQVKGRKKNKRR